MHKILVIEDHLEVRENLHELLELCNYHVISASDGTSGIQMALAEQPDLILCDIMMPGMDGYEVLTTLGRHPETAAIPFIFLTARADKADIRRGMQLGADDYLTKPFEEQDLLRAIQVRLHKSHLLKQPFPRSFEGLKSFFFQARQEGGLPLLTDPSSLVQFAEGQIIFQENETPEYLYFLASGKVRLFRPEAGTEAAVSILYEKGGFFGYKALIQGTTYRHRAEALEPVEVFPIPKNDFFLLLLYNRTFSIRFIQLLANQVKEQEMQLHRMVQKLTQRTVAEMILELCPTSGENHSDTISLETIQSRAHIAKLNFTIALRDLDREKAISLGTDCVQLLDAKKLWALANN
ncbi:MAG: response regulator [Lewinellaceae bacterium]|nr:response regulator [Lewinellaceae bacterium]